MLSKGPHRDPRCLFKLPSLFLLSVLMLIRLLYPDRWREVALASAGRPLPAAPHRFGSHIGLGFVLNRSLNQLNAPEKLMKMLGPDPPALLSPPLRMHPRGAGGPPGEGCRPQCPLPWLCWCVACPVHPAVSAGRGVAALWAGPLQAEHSVSEGPLAAMLRAQCHQGGLSFSDTAEPPLAVT